MSLPDLNRQKFVLLVYMLVLSFYSFGKTKFQNIDFNPNEETDSVYAVVEKDPEFPGGKEKLNDFIRTRLKYPVEAQKNNIQGRVIVQFIVSKTGKVNNVKVVKTVTKVLDDEAVRLVSSFPDWSPAELNGQKVSTYQLIPISFKKDEIIEETPKVVVIDNVKMPANFDVYILNANEIDTGYVKRPISDEIRMQLIKKYGDEAKSGVIEIYTQRFKRIQNKREDFSWDSIPKINPEDENAVYHIIDANKKPIFPGGEKAMYDFIKENLKYPDVCQQIGAQGTAYVQFIVDKTGKIRDAVVKNKVHSLLVAEAIRVVNVMPAWMPAEKQGKKINVRLTLPVQFKLSGNIFPLENDSITNETLSPDRQLVVLDGTPLPYGFDINWLNLSEVKSYELLIPKNAEEEEKEFRLKFGPYSGRGVFVAISEKYFFSIDSNGNKIYDVIEQMPQYPGGEGELLRFVNSNLKYPPIAQTQKLQGTVIVRFVVNSFGDTERVEVLRGLSPECDEEAMRVMKLLKNWIPGKQNGIAVSVHYTLPIRFALM